MLRPLRTLIGELIAISERDGSVARLGQEGARSEDVANAIAGARAFMNLMARSRDGSLFFVVSDQQETTTQALSAIAYGQAVGALRTTPGAGRSGSVFVVSPKRSASQVARDLFDEMLRRYRVSGDGPISADEAVLRAACDNEALPLFIDDTPNLTAWELYDRARSLKRFRGLSLIVVEGVDELREGGNRECTVPMSRTIAALRGIGREIGSPILLGYSAEREPLGGAVVKEMDLAVMGYSSSHGDHALVLSRRGNRERPHAPVR